METNKAPFNNMETAKASFNNGLELAAKMHDDMAASLDTAAAATPAESAFDSERDILRAMARGHWDFAGRIRALKSR